MNRCSVWITAGLLIGVDSATVHGQPVIAPVSKPVDHPHVAAFGSRTSAAWRQGMELFGESLATGLLRLRGYEVIDMKLPGNRGIDLVAIKRTPDGIVSDIRLVEVKTHYRRGKSLLKQTRVGTQMSRQWLADRLRGLRERGPEGKKLALEISRFRRASGIPIEQLGEIHDINLQTGKYTILNPINGAERAGPMSIERLLKRISERLRDPVYKEWATRHLTRVDDIRRARMLTWLSASSSTRAFDRVSRTRIFLLEKKMALRGVRRALVRAASRVAAVIAVAMDAIEIYSQVREYRLGKVSQQEFVTSLARIGGGIVGATVGAAGGAYVGSLIGSLGGPAAPITVPLGSIIGTVVGGAAGYFGGASCGEFAAQMWYGSLDKSVRERVSAWLRETPVPAGN